MDQNSLFISSPDIAATPAIASGGFIYEPKSGRVFFFQNLPTCQDEDHRYCPVCGNLRKAFAAQEKGRQRLNALLADACLQEIDPGRQAAYGSVGGAAAAETVAGTANESCGDHQLRLAPKVAAVRKDWQYRPPTRQQSGIFSRSQSRGPPSRNVALDDKGLIAALSATHLAASPRLPERRA